MASKKEKKKQQKKLFVVVRIRGSAAVNERIERTMKMLRLFKKNRCSLVLSTPSNMGMIKKVQDYCTFGEINPETLQLLLEKRGKIKGDKPLTEDFLKKTYKMSFKEVAEKILSFEKKFSDFESLKQFFKLHPPLGGFERAGIKKPFSVGGALGYRGEEINKLIRRML